MVSSTRNENGPVSKSQKRTALDYLLGPETVTSSTMLPRQELDAYMSETPAIRSTFPHAWWENNQAKYPLLNKVAKYLLNIPTTSTPSERVFSTAGNTVLFKTSKC